MAGTRFEALVNQDVLLGFRHLYNSVLMDADQILRIRILNQNLQEVGQISSGNVTKVDVGTYQAIASGSLFPSSGIYYDVWEIIPISGASQRNIRFEINVNVVPPAQQFNFGQGGVLECSLDELTPCMMKYHYLWPVWSVLSNGYYLPDMTLQYHIDVAITYAQRQLGIPLRQVRVRTQPFADNIGPNPLLGVDYDEEGDLVQWDVADSAHWSSIRLPHSGIIKVHSVRGIYNGQNVYNIPSEWVDRNELSAGWVRIRPTTAGSIANIVDGSGRFLDVTLLEALGVNFVPGFWAIDYDYGQKGGKFPKEICDIIMKKSALTLLDQLGQSISRGLASRSASVDGLSTSVGYVANAERTMFGALARRYEEELADVNLLDMRRRYKGPTVFII